MKTSTRCMLQGAAVLFILCSGARADEITEWNQLLYQAAVVPPATNSLVLARSGAIFQASVYDAVNGIERRFTSIHVAPNAPRGASVRAAAIQAAYASLVRLYPNQKDTFDLRREISLSGVAGGPAAEMSESIQRGVEWGQAVADEIWIWRSTDGFNPATTFPGDFYIGKWRPTPPANAPGVGLQVKYMMPWVMSSPAQFRPGPPPDLTSAQCASDFSEVKAFGSAASAVRTADQTLYSLFWHSAQGNYYWNYVAVALAQENHLTLSETNRLLALLNVSMADALIGCWDAKYEYKFWRPITAIQNAAADSNPLTDADASWTPLAATPPHPEYPSAHACQSSAAARILAGYFGDHTSFSVISNQMAGVARTFNTFSEALEEVNNARIYAGFHFRAACQAGAELGTQVSDFVVEHAFQSLHGNRVGQIRK